MATLTWIGGGSNQASNPNDWIDAATNLPPDRPPLSGDTLTVGSTTANPGPFTMNVSDNDLAGNLLSISPGAKLTANLSDHAVMTAQEFPGSTDIYNLSQQSTLRLFTSGTTVNLSQNSALSLSTSRGSSVVNISGNDTAGVGQSRGGTTTINLAKGARWSGAFNASMGSTIVVNGSPDSVFSNNGSSGTSFGNVFIGVDVAGSGSTNVAIGQVEFAKSVGPQQSIDVGLNGSPVPGLVRIDQPSQFDATVTLENSGQIDLIGLAKADSYTYQNDLLNIFSGQKIIDTLHLTNNTSYGFAVEPPTAAGSVNIVAITNPSNPPPSLPIHIGS